jgi:hypothetical protein
LEKKNELRKKMGKKCKDMDTMKEYFGVAGGFEWIKRIDVWTWSMQVVKNMRENPKMWSQASLAMSQCRLS